MGLFLYFKDDELLSSEPLYGLSERREGREVIDRELTDFAEEVMS